MKRMIIGSLVLLTAGSAFNKTYAQVDPHFTQYYVHTSWLNPALTGQFDGEYRASAIYRNQWGNVANPFKTVGASVEATTSKNMNLGINLVNQSSGGGGFNYTTAYGNFAYTGIRFGKQGFQRIALAIQMGLLQGKINPSKFVFGDQWNPVTGTTNPTQESFNRTSSMTFDAGAGALYYDAEPGKKANVFAGFSASHLTRPENKFSSNGNEKTNVRLTAHGGVRLALSDALSLTPNLLYLRQGTAEEKMAGMYAQLRAAATTDVLLGINYRYKDAIAAQVGFTFNTLVFTMSYDINQSDLGKIGGSANSFEFSVSFTGRKSTKTPEVEFVCPRL